MRLVSTETSVAVDGDSVKDSTLATALQQYIQTVSLDDRNQCQAELARFARWAGPDRKISSLAPPEIGDYSDLVSARGTAPDATERLSIVKTFLAYMKKQGMIEVGLAQHLRVRKGRSSSNRSRASTENAVVRLTRAGHAELVNRLAGYRQERAQLAEEIRRAAADKDVRENAPLEAAREAQGMLLSKIAEIEATLRSAVVINERKAASSNQVTLGSKVTLKDVATGKTMTCQVVEPNEASPLNAKISSVSPVGSAVLGSSAGEEVRVQTPRGIQVYVVVETA